MLLQLGHVGEDSSTAFQIHSEKSLQLCFIPLCYCSILFQFLSQLFCVYEQFGVKTVKMLLGFEEFRRKVLGNDVQMEVRHAGLCMVAYSEAILLLSQHLNRIRGQQFHFLQQIHVFCLKLKWGTGSDFILFAL